MVKNKTTKILALVLSTLMLISAFPMIGFAVSPITIGAVTVADDPTDATITDVTVAYTADTSVGDQITLLVTFDGFDVTFDVADTAQETPLNIVYVDQPSKTGSLVFPVNKASVSGKTIYIKIGGFNVNEPATTTYTFGAGSDNIVVPDADLPTVANVVATTDALGVTGAKLTVINLSSVLPSGGVASDYKVVIKGTELRFNAANNKFVGTPVLTTDLLASDIVITKEARTVSDIVFGDISNDNGTVNTADLTYLVSKITDDTLVLPNQDLSADLNGDGVVNTADLTYLVAKIADSTVVFPANQ